MCVNFTEDDVGKAVVNANGDEIGIVSGIEGGTARVDPDPGITGSIKAAIGWEDTGAGTVPLREDAVESVYENEVRISGSLSTQGEPVGDSSLEEPETETERGESSERMTDTRDPTGPRSGDEGRDATVDETVGTDDREIGTREGPETESGDVDAETSVGEPGTVRESSTDRAADSGTDRGAGIENEGRRGSVEGDESTDSTDARRRSGSEERLDRGMEADPKDVTPDDTDAETRPEESVRERTDAEMDVDSEMGERTDAEMDVDAEMGERTDAEVDPTEAMDPRTDDDAGESTDEPDETNDSDRAA